MKMINEIYRVLSPKGIYFAISYGLPEHRFQYLDKPEYDWYRSSLGKEYRGEASAQADDLDIDRDNE